ncbi:TPR-like protein [Auriculariales sp. MPI-PUGE-AT-0066]|nr:TPR-like protein [Auriculariales sp. MPI-PUGE-AT-0066]
MTSHEIPLINDDEFFFGDDDEGYGSEKPSETGTHEQSDEDEHDELLPSSAALGGAALVEDVIEGRFDRLVGSINSAHALTDQGAMSELWNANVREDLGDDLPALADVDFRDELRQASGIGKRKGIRRQRSRPALSVQVRALLSDATTAFINRELERVVEILEEVIQIEPRDPQAWDMLSSTYEEMQDLDRALQFKIIAAHLRHDSEAWHELGRQSHQKGHIQQALYCYQKTCQLDPNNIDALWDRGVLCRDSGNLRGARAAFLALNEQFPEDMAVVLELQGVLRALGDTGLLITILERAMHLLQLAYPTGRAPSIDGSYVAGGGFGENAVAILADFCNEIGDFDKSIHIVRSGTRWLQGRLEQRFWDGMLDDHEFDGPGMARFEAAGPGAPFNHLSLNLRQRLAVSRIRLGETDEGRAHAALVLQQEVALWGVLFPEIAEAFFHEKLYDDAIPVYEQLAENEDTSGVDVLMRLAECYRHTGKLAEAGNAYQTLLGALDASDAETVKKVKLNLAEVYEMKGDLHKALDIVYQVFDARNAARTTARSGAGPNEHDAPEPATGSSSLFFEESGGKSGKRKPGKSTANARLNAAQLEEALRRKQAQIDDAWKRLADAEDQLRQGMDPVEAEGQWLADAEFLVETFRTARELFTSTQQKGETVLTAWRKLGKKADEEGAENDLATRLQLELADAKGRRAKHDPDVDVNITYRGVSFDTWITLLLNYVFVLTRRGQYSTAEEVLKHVACSKVFSDATSQDTLRFGRIACAMFDQRYDVVVDMCRKFILTYQMQSEPFSLLNACLASGFQPANSFQDSKLQKQLNRETRLMHAVVSGDATEYHITPQGRFQVRGDAGTSKKAVKDDEGLEDDVDKCIKVQPPEKETTVPWAVLSQTFLNARSWQSAIFYLMHAYEVQPRDPMVCFSLGVTCIGRAMQRQADNRHHMIVQGMAFFAKYRELRRDSHQEEVNYNMGRAFHQLSLFSEALQLYQKVLDAVERRLALNATADIGLARETAYNMSLIYTQTGAAKLAQELYRRWLSL